MASSAASSARSQISAVSLSVSIGKLAQNAVADHLENLATMRLNGADDGLEIVIQNGRDLRQLKFF